MCFVSFEPHTTKVMSILKRRKQVQRGDGTSPTSHSLEVAEPGCELRQFGSLTSLCRLCLRAIPKLFRLLVPKDVCIPHLCPSHSGPPQSLHPSLSLVFLPSFLFSFSFLSISLFVPVCLSASIPPFLPLSPLFFPHVLPLSSCIHLEDLSYFLLCLLFLIHIQPILPILYYLG